MAQKFTTGITVRDLASAASDAVAVSVAGDTNDRIKFEAGGKVVWGSGATAGDVNLYRDAADRLKTDDALQADGGLITVTTAGTPTLSLPDGALAIDTVNSLLYIRTGGVWEIASGGGASVTTSDGAPADPEDGDLWYETDTGSMFVYYDDGASQQWVEVGTAGVIAMTTSDTAPSTPANGDLWFDTSTAKTYVYYDDGSSQQWVEVGAASAAASGTDGAVQFASGGTFSSDASNLVWDDTNNRLGIGTTTPADKLHVEFTSGSAAGIVLTNSGGTVGKQGMRIGFDNDRLTIQRASDSGAWEANYVTVDQDSGNVGIGTTTPAYPLEVDGAIQAERYRGENALVLNNYTTANPSSNVYLYSPPNDRDAWIYLDSSTTASNWGIYHRQIDSDVGDVASNSIAFVGGGSSSAQAYIGLGTGDIWARGDITSGGPDGGMVMRSWTGSSSFGMIGTANMTGSEYALLTDGTNTYLSGGTGGSVWIRGGNNDQQPQLVISNDEVQLIHDVSGGLGANLWIRNGVTAVNTGAAVTFECDASTDTAGPNGRIETRLVNATSGSSIMLFDIWNGSSFVETIKISAAYGSSGASGVSFANAAVALDRGWANYPSITVFNNPATTEFRIHGANTYYGAYPGTSGSDFSVNLRIDGATYYSSDSRHKTNIVDNPYGLTAINQLQPRKFDRINSDGDIEDHATDILGFIAQEVMEVIPEAVTYYADEDTPNENGWCRSYSLSESYIVSTLVNAVKELSAKNDLLEERIATLEAN